MSSSQSEKPELVQQQQQQPSLHQFVSTNISTFSKLLFFMAALATFPILTYFYTVSSVFEGNSTYAGGAAAIVANLVVIAYIVVAIYEDKPSKVETKKTQ